MRLFSIDGCHSARATRGDLRLAAASLAGRTVVIRSHSVTQTSMRTLAACTPEYVCLRTSGATVSREDSRFQCSHVTSADGGVVILDDVFNADWPETYLGLALYMEGYLYEQLQVRRALLCRLGVHAL